MQSMPVNKLKDKIHNTNVLNEDNVSNIIIKTRKALEDLDFTREKRFETLMFYCNWCLHSTMDKRLISSQMLQKITSILHLNPQNPNQPWYVEAMMEIFDLKNLKSQLIEFYKENNISTKFFDSFDQWEVFCNFILNILLEQKIKFPKINKNTERNIRAIYEEIKLLAEHKNGLACKAIEIVKNDPPKSRRFNLWNWKVHLFRDYVFCEGPFIIS